MADVEIANVEGGERPALGVLHPGQMGALLASEAVRGGTDVRWNPIGRSTATARRAAAAGLRASKSLGDLLADTQVLLSICPPIFAEQVAEEVVRLGFAGIYIEANAI